VKGVSSAFAASNALAFTIVNLDLAQQTLRFGRTTGDLGLIRPMVVFLWRWYLGIGAVATAVLLLVGAHPAAWVVVGTAAYLVGSQLGVVANGLSGPTSTALGAVLQQIGMIAGTALAWALGELNENTVRLVVIVSYLAPVPLFWAVSRKTSVSRTPFPREAIRLLIRGGLRWQPARVAQFALLRLDTLVVFGVLGAASAGVYSVGLSTASLVGIIPAQFASNATYQATQGQGAAVGRNATRALWAGMVGALIVALVGWPMIAVAYGQQYEASFAVLLAALPGVVAYSVLQVHTNHLRIIGSARDIAIASGLGVAAMVIALAVLVPAIGVLGAALASSVGAGVAAMAAHIAARRIGQ
jgi:O-antigen/teichoic acid export membrane protein